MNCSSLRSSSLEGWSVIKYNTKKTIARQIFGSRTSRELRKFLSTLLTREQFTSNSNSNNKPFTFINKHKQMKTEPLAVFALPLHDKALLAYAIVVAFLV
jgi:hypothetical protein